MDPIYLVCWTGGLEEPSFFLARDLIDAQAKMRVWSDESHSVGDRVDIIEIRDKASVAETYVYGD